MSVHEPITNPIPPQKQSVRRHFGSHPYFTRRPWNVVQEYIKHFAPGKEAVVLDPFGGSGVTAIEALVLGKFGVHADINPLANFICRQIAIGPVDLTALRVEFHRLEDNCRAYIDRLFQAKDETLESLDITDWYPRNIPLPRNADADFIEELFSKRQLLALSRLYAEIRKIDDPVVRDLLRFTFSATLNKCNRTYSTTKGRSEGRGNSGIMHTYRYWIPKEPVELNVWSEFNQKFTNIWRVKRETNQAIGDRYKKLKVLQVSATRLSTELPAKSVDYIFTDPPYGSHIGYLDLSTMWNAWLEFPVTQESRELEAIEGGDLEKTRDDYSRLLSESFREMGKVLKPSGWLSLVFAHKEIAYWHLITSAAEEAGFYYANTVVQESFQPSRHKRANPLSVLSGELILNFTKNISVGAKIPKKAPPDEIEFVVTQSRDLLEKSKTGLTTEDMYNQLVPRLLEHGMLKNGKNASMIDLNGVLQLHFFFDEENARWYLSSNDAEHGRDELHMIQSRNQRAFNFS